MIATVVSGGGHLPRAILIDFRVPLTVNLLLLGDVLLCVLDLVINSEVWHEIVFWWSLRFLKA